MFFDTDEGRVDIPARMEVHGSGSDPEAPLVDRIATVVDEGDVTLVGLDGATIALARVVGADLGEGPHLSGTITATGETAVLAVLRGV